MSTGNGGGTFSQRVTAGLKARTAEMSAVERSAQADAIRRQLVELTAAHNRLVALVDELQARVLTIERHIKHREPDALARLNACERWASGLDTSFRARLRWLVRGR